MKAFPIYPETALAYAALYTAGRYAVHYRVLSEVRRRVPFFIPRRLLKYGAKEGSGIL